MKIEFEEGERARMLRLLSEHDLTCGLADPTKRGAIGGRLTWQVTETALGQVTKVLCACGHAMDFSDYDGW